MLEIEISFGQVACFHGLSMYQGKSGSFPYEIAARCGDGQASLPSPERVVNSGKRCRERIFAATDAGSGPIGIHK